MNLRFNKVERGIILEALHLLLNYMAKDYPLANYLDIEERAKDTQLLIKKLKARDAMGLLQLRDEK